MPHVGLIPFDAMLVRPAYQAGESLAGYVSRLQWVNGRRVTSKAMREVARFHGWWSDSDRAVTTLRAIVGSAIPLDADEWRRLRPERFVSRDWRQLWNDSLNRVRYCGPCVQSKGVHLSVWQLPAIAACPEHGCRLFDACPTCKRPLAWTALEPEWLCSCKTALPMSGASEAGTEELFFARLLVQAHVGSSSGVHACVAAPASALGSMNDIYAALIDAREFFAKGRRRAGWRHVFWDASGHARDPAKVLLQAMVEDDSRWIRALICENHEFGERFMLEVASSPVLRALRWAGESQRLSGSLSSWICRQLAGMLRECAAPLPVTRTVLMDPSLSEKDRDRRLVTFAEWWCDATCGLEIGRDHGHVDEPRDGVSASTRERSNSAALLVLQALLTAAMCGPATAQLRGVIATWPWAARAWPRDPKSLLAQLYLSLPRAPKELAVYRRDLLDVAGRSR